MKPAAFAYHSPASLDEVLSLKTEYGDDAQILAGGQSLIALMALRLSRPENVVDINGVESLAEVRTTTGVRIGAIVRQRAVERSDTLATAAPLLAQAIRFIGHAPIRNRGTVGGSLAHADPAAELPAVVLALDGELEATSSRGVRRIPAADFFQGFLTTALDSDEVLTAVELPAWTGRTGSSFQEFSRRSGDFALAGVAVTVRLDDQGDVGEARIALSGMDQIPVRARAAEATLSAGTPSDELWRAGAADAVADLTPPSDLHGTRAYRRHLASVLVRRGLQEAYERARERE